MVRPSLTTSAAALAGWSLPRKPEPDEPGRDGRRRSTPLGVFTVDASDTTEPVENAMRNGRIFIDLQKSDAHGNVPASVGTHRDMFLLRLQLVEGMRVGIYDYDVDDHGRDDCWTGEATAVYDHDADRWTFEVDEATLRHESDIILDTADARRRDDS